METRRAILVDGSRLMRELVRRIIEKSAGFEVVRELSNVQELPAAITDTNVEWVFTIVTSNHEIPEILKNELFFKHPTLRIVGLWVDGSHVKVEWLGRQHKDLTGLTLNEITHLLREELQELREEGDETNKNGRLNGNSEGHYGMDKRANQISFFTNLNATRVIATTIGVFFGLFSGINHGLFELLQGNTPTNGLFIHAIGEAQRFWPLGTEDAFTLIPNFMFTGIASMIVGLAIIIWSLWFLPGKHGPTVFLGLFILSFLVGGGIGQVAFFIPAWAFATRMNTLLTWWRKVLPQSIWTFLSRLWIVTLVLATISILIGLEMAIFGFFPGLTDPEAIQDTALRFVSTSAILYIVTFIAGFGHELKRMEQTV